MLKHYNNNAMPPLITVYKHLDNTLPISVEVDLMPRISDKMKEMSGERDKGEKGEGRRTETWSHGVAIPDV